jgi:2-oxoglutarate dehydrogenase E1 component
MDVIELVCYHDNGHNRDQPVFTQPKLYKEISRHPPTLDIFEKWLIEEGTLSKEECQEIRDFTLESYFEASRMNVEKETDWLSSRWT